MMMILTPTFIKAPIGSTIEFNCKYYHKELLDIYNIENGVVKFRNTDQYMKCDNEVMKRWFVKVSEKPITVQCMLRNKQMLTVGMLTAHILPGLMLFRSQQCALLYLLHLGNILVLNVLSISCIYLYFPFQE